MSAGGRRLARVAGARGASSSVMVATAAACPRGPPERKIAPRPARPTRYDRAAARDGGRNDPGRRRSSAGARARAVRSLQQRESDALGEGAGAHVWPCVSRLARLDAIRRALLATDARQQVLSHRASWSGRSSSPARHGLARARCGARRWTWSSAASCCAARRESPSEPCRTSRQRASRAGKASARGLDFRVGEIILWKAASSPGAGAPARSGSDTA